MKHMLAVALASVLGLHVQAVTVTYPSTSGDFSTAAGWNDNLPTQADTAQFNGKGPFTASQDVTFSAMLIGANGCTFDLTGSDSTVELKAGANVTSFAFTTRDWTGWIKGGTWKSSGAAYFTAGGKALDTLIITNGASLTVSGTLSPGYTGNGSKMIVTGGSTVQANKITVARSNSTGCALEVRGGATLNVSDVVGTEDQSTCYNNTILVSGKGTEFKGASGKNVQIGYCTYGGKLIVEDGATFSCGSLYVGSYLNTSVSHDNFVYADKATITTGQAFAVGRRGPGNVAEFTNTAVTVGMSFHIGDEATSTSNVVRFIGPDAALSYASDKTAPFFSAGSYNSLSFEDGASHVLTVSDVILSGAAHHNRVLLKNGGALRKTGGKAYISTTNSAKFATSYANTIEIESCATNQFYDMYIGSTDNRIVVSNGVLLSERTDPNGYSLHFGAKWDTGADPARNALVLKGASPRVEITDSGINLDHASLLRFEIPAEGYAETPVQVRKLTLSEDSVLEVDCAALAANPQSKTQKICLADCTGTNGLSIPDSVLAAANVGLPERCSLYTEDGKLMLKIPGTGGLILIFR